MATIKAGTYVFVEEPTITEAYNQSLNYKAHYLTAENVYATDTYDTVRLAVSVTWGGTIMFSPANSTDFPVTGYTGNTKQWKSSLNESSGNLTATDNTKLRTIIIETDQTVADDFYTWFTANTALQPKLSIDLTTLPGWANLSTGNHTIKIKAKGTGYTDSELSAGVVVSKAASTVTLEAGTYKWKDNMSVSDTFPINDYKEVFSFESNGITDFAKIRFYISGDYYSMYYEPNGSFAEAWYGWGNNWWYNTYDGDSSAAPGLQTITLATDQQVSAEFYKWAITDGNLVKQITDLTGTKWKFNSSYTKVGEDAQYWFNIIGKLTLNDTAVIENSSSNPYIWVRTSDVENWTMFCVNKTQNTWSTVYPYANARGQYNDIFYEYSSGSSHSYPRATTSIVLEIYSGSDTTNSTFIEWLKANATLIE